MPKDEEAGRFSAEAKRIREALINTLWIEEEGRFAGNLNGTHTALHPNILAFYFNIGPRDKLIDYLRPLLEKNFTQGIEKGQWSGHAELYFLSYVLPALAEHGEYALAEKIIEEHYGFLRSLGHNTRGCFCRAHRKVGSLCHTWSGGGAIYIHRIFWAYVR